MTYVEWPEVINQRYFDVVDSYDDNTIRTQFSSGREVRFLKNTKFPKIIEFKLSLNHTSGEYRAFWMWWQGVLGGCAGVFRSTALNDLGESGDKYYRFKEVPTVERAGIFRILSCKVEEV